MQRLLGVCILAGLLTACASHRPVKVTCSGHLVRINALPPAHVEPLPAAPPAPAEGSPTPPLAEEDSPQ
jgi:hypothetical protein